MRAATHTPSKAPPSKAPPKDGVQASAARSESASLQPPRYGIGHADRAPERISHPGETGERAADAVAQQFLAAHRSVGAEETPAAFGRFTGHDVSSVRIHRDTRADAQARALGTGAFTLGEQIGVASGEHRPEVLAHELAHVVAQRAESAHASTLWRKPPSGDAERRKQTKTAGKPKQKPAAPQAPAKAPAASAAKPSAAASAATGPAPLPFVHKFFLLGVPGDLLNRDLGKRYPELRLNGSEWYGAWSFGWALLNPLMQPPVVKGGDATPGQWSQDYTRFTKYVSALQKLTPGKGDPYLDIASLATGTRVEDWLGHDRVFPQAFSEYWWQLLLALAAAQGAYSGYAAYKNQDPGPEGTLQTDPTYRHFELLTGLAGLVLKSKFLTLGGNPLSFAPAISNEIALPSSGPLSSGIPGAGLSLDFQKGVGQEGHRYTFGTPFNLGRLIRPDEAGKPKSGLELGAWGSYDEIAPTATQIGAGSEPSKTWSVGALGGYNWLGGADYRFRQTGGLTMHQGSLGLGYLPREPGDVLKAGPVSFPRFGVAGTYTDWSGASGSVLGPRLGGDSGQAGRLSPYLDLGFDLGAGRQLSIGGQPSVTFRSADSFQAYLDGLRLTAALQQQAKGASDADRKRIELSYSLNRYEWLDPNSPLMHGLMLKGQWGPWFGGAQVNWMQGGLEGLEGGPYARDFATSTDPLRNTSLLFNFGYRFAPFDYPWGVNREGFHKNKPKR